MRGCMGKGGEQGVGGGGGGGALVQFMVREAFQQAVVESRPISVRIFHGCEGANTLAASRRLESLTHTIIIMMPTH
jgi:hypothetical protein